MTLSLVHCLSSVGPLLVENNSCILGTHYKTCCFGNALTQSSSHHNLAAQGSLMYAGSKGQIQSHKRAYVAHIPETVNAGYDRKLSGHTVHHSFAVYWAVQL